MLKQYIRLGLFVRSINEWTAKIRVIISIEWSVITYVARHTFSTALKKASVSTEYIREVLGHTSIQTTENYLDSFEKEIKKEYANKLMALKQKQMATFRENIKCFCAHFVSVPYFGTVRD